MTCTTCGLSALGIAMDGKPYCYVCVNWKVELKAHRNKCEKNTKGWPKDMRSFAAMVLLILGLVISVHAQGVRPDYCDHDPVGRSVSWNLWHCGAPDERRPKERVSIETESPAEMTMIEAPDSGMKFEFIDGKWMIWYNQLSFGSGFIYSGSGITTLSTSENYRRGGDAQLAALGPTVWVGDIAMGHICIRGQKYVSTVTLRENEYSMTLTCAKDELHLIGPVVRHKVLKVNSVPYTGGSTWMNVQIGSK